MKQYKIFLGGTVSPHDWRNIVISALPSEVAYFNPVVSEGSWTTEHIEIENKEKAESDCVLVIITPEMRGCYSIAELIYLSLGGKTVVYGFIGEFDESIKKSLEASAQLIAGKPNAIRVYSLQEAADVISVLSTHELSFSQEKFSNVVKLSSARAERRVSPSEEIKNSDEVKSALGYMNNLASEGELDSIICIYEKDGALHYSHTTQMTAIMYWNLNSVARYLMEEQG